MHHCSLGEGLRNHRTGRTGEGRGGAHGEEAGELTLGLCDSTRLRSLLQQDQREGHGTGREGDWACSVSKD